MILDNVDNKSGNSLFCSTCVYILQSSSVMVVCVYMRVFFVVFVVLLRYICC